MKIREIPNSAFVPIVGDGAIATRNIGEGRAVPVLIIDCATRPDLRDLIVAHETQPPGDVKVSWATPRFRRSDVYLLLEFSRPARINAALSFDIAKQGTLVDGILHCYGVYLQPKEAGISVSLGIGKSKILVEVPDTHFMPQWNEIYHRELAREFRRRGLARRNSRDAAKALIQNFRQIWRFRRET